MFAERRGRRIHMLGRKVHITNIYGLLKNRYIADRQKIIAKHAHELGWLEMGVYVYPTETDSQEELDKRLDGIISAVEQGDIVFLQLPTENGIEFDKRLLNKVRTYPDVKIVLMWQSEKYYTEYHYQLSYMADYECRPEEIFNTLKYSNNLFVKKLLLNSAAQAASQKKVSRNAIHIGMGIHDRDGNYSAWAATTIQSIIQNTEADVVFHIIHDSTVNETIKRKLNYSVSGTKHMICFHEIDTDIFGADKELMGIYTIGALYRVLLPEICGDLPRIIYLDSDLLVNCDIQELWDIDISDYFLAAVPDKDVVEGRIWAYPVSIHEMKREAYFNSGVIYMNLNKIRENGNMRKLVENYLKNNKKNNLSDQDALNVIYQEKVLLLDGKWNRFMRHVSSAKEQKLQDCIYHYVGTVPILYLNLEPYQLYLETISKTAWGKEKSNDIIQSSIGRQLARESSLRNLIYQTACRRKKYIFYGEETWAMKKMYKLLSASKETDYRIMNDASNNFGELPDKNLDALDKETKGDYIVFVLPQADQGHAIDNLCEMGLQREQDFFVIPVVLSVLDGGYLK